MNASVMHQESKDFISKEMHLLLSARIAFHIGETENNSIYIDDLITKITTDNLIKPSINAAWMVLQVKNEMIKKSLLYVSFNKPLQQLIGLTLKGKAVFHK